MNFLAISVVYHLTCPLTRLSDKLLERCIDSGDWLRREIETALDEKRNIVPLFFEGFSFGSPPIAQHLTGKLTMLKNYNGLSVPADFFSEAMERLQTRFLNVALDTVLHPVSIDVQRAVKQQQIAASSANLIREKELNAQEWFEKGFKETVPDEQFYCYTQAILLQPNYVEAYNNRGIARKTKGDLDGAIKDYTEAIRLNPNNAQTFNNRGNAYRAKGNLNEAIKDYTDAIRLNPNYSLPYNGRGNAYQDKGDLDKAIKDYTEAIHLLSGNADGYYNRANAWSEKGDFFSAIADYQKCLKLGDTDPGIPQKIRELKKEIK